MPAPKRPVFLKKGKKMPNNTVIEELRLEHITKRFPGVLACDDISLSVGKHEVLALVGENGPHS